MVDQVSNNSSTQRIQLQAAANLRNNQKIAQTLLNQIQNPATSPVKSVVAVSQPAKSGTSNNVPRGSLVDITV